MSKKMMISIVDDNESVREAMTGLMRSVGFSAQAFQSAEGFLRSSRLDRTACLVTDMQMPGMTGLELYRRLIAAGKPIPTILITAYPDESVRARAKEAGVICYLTKPFNEDDLLSCIRRALERWAAGGKES